MKLVRLLRLAECPADPVDSSVCLKLQFAAVSTTLPRTVNIALLVKCASLFLAVKSVKHNLYECGKRAFSPGIWLFDDIHAIGKTDGEIMYFTKIFNMTT